MALVTTKEMFRKAYEGGYAIGAFNINNMEIIQAITEAAQEKNSPVILQVSAGARKYAKHAYLMALARAAVEDTGVDMALHLDHGADFEICKSCIDGGFTSVMIDGSHHSFEDNIAVTKKVVEYAHAHGVVVEGELGRLAGVEDDVKVSAADSSYTRPEEVEEFVTRTGVDSLAIAIGTSHGAYKFTPEQCTRNKDGVLVPPPLRFDILEEVEKRLPGFPIVLHGASSVAQAAVAEINRLGGKMPDAIGIPDDELRRAAKMAVCKINIDSDIRLAMTAGTTLCISLALYPLAQLLFRLFSSDDAVVAQGVQMMHYLVPVYMTYICIEIFSGALRGCGDVRVPTIITVFAVCIMRIVWLAVALPFKHELSVVEFSYPLTWITATVLFAIYYAKGGWMQRCIAAQNAKTQG